MVEDKFAELGSAYNYSSPILVTAWSSTSAVWGLLAKTVPKFLGNVDNNLVISLLPFLKPVRTASRRKTLSFSAWTGGIPPNSLSRLFAQFL